MTQTVITDTGRHLNTSCSFLHKIKTCDKSISICIENSLIFCQFQTIDCNMKQDVTCEIMMKPDGLLRNVAKLTLKCTDRLSEIYRQQQMNNGGTSPPRPL